MFSEKEYRVLPRVSARCLATSPRGVAPIVSEMVLLKLQAKRANAKLNWEIFQHLSD